jgi:hypothetical protein
MQPRSSTLFVQWNRACAQGIASLTFSNERAGHSVARSGATDIGSSPQPDPELGISDPALNHQNRPLHGQIGWLPSHRFRLRCSTFVPIAASSSRRRRESRIKMEARISEGGRARAVVRRRWRSLPFVRTFEPFDNLSGGILCNFN